MSAVPNEIIPPTAPHKKALSMGSELPTPANDSLVNGQAATEPATASAADRGMPSVNRPRSLQTRLSRMVALVLLLSLGSGLLGWYYQQTASRQTRSSSTAVASAQSRAAGESTVPPLEVGDPPDVPPARQMSKNAADHIVAAELAVPTADTPIFERMVPRPVAPAPWGAHRPADSRADTQVYRVQPRPGDAPAGYRNAAAAAPSGYGTAPPVQSDLARRLTGPAFASTSSAGGSSLGTATLGEAMADPPNGMTAPSAEPSSAVAERGALATQLRPTVLAAAQAKLLPSRRLLLPKGALIDCTLQSAIDSSLPGLTTCLTATDTFGADGKVVLLERGTTLVGETRGEARRGGKRLFVLWNEARTPTGVVVELASPATDALGRAGLSGEVDRHFWERFGAATLLSVLDGAVQAGVAASRQSGSSAIDVSPSASRDILSEALHDTADITPTIRIAHGTRLQILVARDLDFRSVYALEYHASP